MPVPPLPREALTHEQVQALLNGGGPKPAASATQALANMDVLKAILLQAQQQQPSSSEGAS